MILRRLAVSAAMLALAAPAVASPAIAPEDQALDLMKRAIGFRSVRGPGNQTPQLAAYLKTLLVAGGFAEGDVTVTRHEDTAFLVARYRGSDPQAKPLLLSGHIDVVEAKPADWTRDPFTAIVEKDYLYGRGSTDMKMDMALMVTALLELKKAHVVPKRDIVLMLSGDEETSMATSRLLAKQFPQAAMLLNGDGGGGVIDDTSGRPRTYYLEAAEKAYGDYELTITNAGGHSSKPTGANAIYELAAVLARIGAYRFTPELNDITRARFLADADRAEPKIGAAMRAFAKDPADAAAIATLAADPANVGQIGTTCVATMLNAGHAENALPQRAWANINCRIFPGHSFAEIGATLARVAAEPKLQIKFVDGVSTASPASTITPAVTQSVRAALDAAGYKGVPIVPSMAAGASDSMWFRVNHIPSYGVAPIFIKDSDDFSHGLNERTPVANIAPGLAYWKVLLTKLAN
jgi:carboxypeptidase PM20D1